jgi:hypothetical protein
MPYQKFLIVSILSLIALSSGQMVLGYGGPPTQSSTNNYTVEIISDDISYALGESVIFSGNVNKYDEERNLRISIFSTGNNLVLSQTTSVGADGTFSHNVTLDEKFSDGTFKVKAQYGNSKTTVTTISFEVTSSDTTSVSQNNKIPDWIKNNAGWWADGSIDDNSFVEGIQFLIKEGFMNIPITEQGSVSQNNKIPDWIKNNAGWWADGSIDDNSFVEGIQFLIKEGFMKLSK